MNMRLVRALSALAAGCVAVPVTGAAQAATVSFASTVAFTESVGNLTFSSTGLNAILTVGTPDIIPQFIKIDVANGGQFGASNESITATFTFTVPTPTGTTTDSGSINGGQVNGGSRFGSLSILWPNQPVEFDFADGTKLDVTLGNLSVSCIANGCLDDNAPYFMSGTFLVLNGPTTGGGTAASATPIPAALPLFASGLGALGFFGRRRKKKAAALAT
jgi:hypothetical protein